MLYVEFSTNGVDEVVESAFYWLKYRAVGGCCGCEHSYPCFMTFDIKVGTHHYGFAINVHNGCFWAIDGELVCAEAVDIGVFVDLACEKLDAYYWGFDWFERVYHGHVDKPVLHTCFGCNKCVVAVL